MTNQREFSNVTKNYLSRFYHILDEMIRGMTGAELTDSISHNFIVQMIPHHRAAIEMAQSILQYTTLVPLQNIASNIVAEQTRSIENMTAVLDSCGQLQNTQQELALYGRCLQEIMKVMFAGMERAKASNDINADFMREMIPHHRGAIEMSENALRFPICPQLKPILQAIIVSQRAGVQEMEQLLGCIAPARCEKMRRRY